MADHMDKLPVRQILLSDDVTDRSIGNVIRDMFEVQRCDGADRIELWISSHGGSIDAGLALYDVVQDLTVPVDTVVTGCAMSMGIPLLQAGENRYATPNSRLMIHPAKGGYYGRIDEGMEAVRDAKKLERQLHTLVAKRVGMTYQEYMKFMGEAKYMSPTQGLKYNFIDAIRRPPCD